MNCPYPLVMNIRLFPAFVAIAIAQLFPFNAILRAADAVPAPLRIVIIGDSTVCDYPETSPSRGWGQFIQERFKDGDVKVINLAAAGRSTKTFIKEGRWQKALDSKPDYVLIQFGHNDSHGPEKPESTDAATDYKDYFTTLHRRSTCGRGNPDPSNPDGAQDVRARWEAR
jgi:lysophospholipase L1-like esterase